MPERMTVMVAFPAFSATVYCAAEKFTTGVVGVVAPHGVKAEVEMRGFGACSAKSLALLSVSVQPPPMRVSDWFAEGTGAGAPSKQVVVPKSRNHDCPFLNDGTACRKILARAQQHDLSAGAAEADVSDDRIFTRHRLAGTTVTIEPEEQMHTWGH